MSSTAGEKLVFATLARLADNCLIYYEPVVRRRYPDLIAILPEVGVLVIEVKDWWLAELSSVNADTVTITRRGTATVVPHPRPQARIYAAADGSPQTLRMIRVSSSGVLSMG
jgi:hypothetical protein